MGTSRVSFTLNSYDFLPIPESFSVLNIPTYRKFNVANLE
ncbi:hypothetical protein KsCSTR_12180 [Candidatus Kuenenia stuttgartiensis]|uniref:Uncharacterized protein n=1 Tax=Kuenenia stuttgartiensis TaxID=174633 RepID=A0A6G7GN21_KUEST|nr:hypothetical protein KsCSTR_12180 [Candidatus Kuenenia stuttgartiensis]